MAEKNLREDAELRAEAGKRAEVRKRGLALVLAAAAVIAVGGAALWWFLRPNKSGAGRPVPAPRTLTLEQPSTGGAEAPSAETLTLQPEALARAGIKLEPVGERSSAEGGGARTTGIVQPNAYRTIPVVSPVGGIVRRVQAELGQHVERGQVLVVVFSDELAMAQSKYLTALAELEEHHQHHRRTQELLEIGAASREELEQSTTKIRSAEAEVAALRQRLLFLGLSPQKVASLHSPSQVSSEVSLPAPGSGTIISRSANPGEVIEANKELLRVADLSSVWVIAQVYEKDLSRVRVGSGAAITAETYPGRVFRGRVTYLDPTIKEATRTAQVRVEAENRGQPLKIGMYVSVALSSLSGARPSGASVAAAAVQQIGNERVVFVATSNPNTFVFRRVRLGPEANGYYPVLDGLSPGERVVTEGSFPLRAEWLKSHPIQ